MQNYRGRIEPEVSEWKDSPWAELLKERYRLAALFCKNKVVLDSCCGTGWATNEYIVPVAHTTIAFDVSYPKSDVWSPDSKFYFLYMDARRMEFPPRKFDVVLALDSLEHFSKEDGLKYLREMERVCKFDGLVIGTTPLVPCKSLIPYFLKQNKYHLQMYIPETLTDTLEGIFPVVSVHKVYNRICPYLVFICAMSIVGKQKHNDAVQKLIEFRKSLDCYTKLGAILFWLKLLLGR